MSSAGGPKASMSGSSVTLRVAAWNSVKAAAANGSGALGKRREAARAVASAGAPGSESMMSGAFASSREGPASPQPEASAGGRSVECGSMLSCDERLLAGVESTVEKSGRARGVGLLATVARARRRVTTSRGTKISFPAWSRDGVGTLRMALSIAASAGDAA